MNTKSADYYEVDSLLNEENKLVRDSVRDWVKENVSPVIEECNLNGHLAKKLKQILGEFNNINF